MQQNTGFTLIELLIVALILGMIASVVVPQFNNSTDTARLNTARSTAANIQSAIEVYRARLRSYPQGTGTVCNTAPKIEGTDVADVAAGGTPDFKLFVAQLAFYSNDAGEVCATNTNHPHGPFIKLENGSLPANPVNGKNDIRFILPAYSGIGQAADSATRRSDSKGWVYDVSVGEFAAIDKP